MPCDCGAIHEPDRNFYVTVVDGDRHGKLAGPYKTHGEALADVEAVRSIAIDLDSKAHFYGFGTASTGSEYTKPGILNAQLAVKKGETC